MRQGSNGRRGRGRGSNSGGGRKPQNNRNQSFDSNGPSGRIRGTATQLHEKYLTLARDASTSGDRITAESCYQYADHYYRIVLANQAPPDSYLEESGNLDGDDGGQRQNGRDQYGREGNGRDGSGRDGNGRDGGNRDQNQRRRVNGNGHDNSPDVEGAPESDRRDEGNRDGGSRDGGNRDSGNRNGAERRARRDSGSTNGDEPAANTEAGETEEVAAKPAATRRRTRRDDTDEAPTPERRRTRRPSAVAEASPPAENVADDAELKRALGVGGDLPVSTESTAEAPADVEAEAEEAVEKPRRRRRAPSTRVSD